MKNRWLVLLLVLTLLVPSALLAQSRRDFGNSRSPQNTSQASPQRREEPRPSPSPPSPPPQVPPAPLPVPVAPPVIFLPIPVNAPLDESTPPPAPNVPMVESSSPADLTSPVLGEEIYGWASEPGLSGYAFGDGSIVAYDDADADLFFDGESLQVPEDTDIQEIGPSNGVLETLHRVRPSWALEKRVGVTAGHQYLLWRWNGDLIKLYVEDVEHGESVVFDWMPSGQVDRPRPEGELFGK